MVFAVHMCCFCPRFCVVAAAIVLFERPLNNIVPDIIISSIGRNELVDSLDEELVS